MPANISFSSSRAGVLPSVKRFTALGHKSVVALQQLIREEFTRRLPLVEITDQARARWPVLTDLAKLAEVYPRCFEVERADDEWRLHVDTTTLKMHGLPATLPMMLEYGSEAGIAPVAHLRPAWSRFLKEHAPRLAREVMNDAI